MKQKPPQTLTLEECDTLLSHLLTYPAEYDGKRRAIRDSCIALCMLDAGLRVSEVIGIQKRSKNHSAPSARSTPGWERANLTSLLQGGQGRKQRFFL